jgi:hypothetical protein
MAKVIWSPGSYRIEKNNIWITSVIHGARNWKPPI